MRIKRKAFMMVPGCMILILVIGLLPGSGCLAADGFLKIRSSTSTEFSKIRSITPAESAASPIQVRAEDYFDIVGTLNLIENRRVVIGNTELRLAGRASTSGVSQYDQVGAQLNKKGEVTAIELISDLPH